MVATITMNPKSRDCVVINIRSKVTLQGVPSNPPSITSNYNMVDQLKQTPTQILLFELLHISPVHKAVLYKALQDSVFARDIDENTPWLETWQLQRSHSLNTMYLQTDPCIMIPCTQKLSFTERRFEEYLQMVELALIYAHTFDQSFRIF